jgi:Phage integrase family
MVQAGIDLYKVQRLLGHKSPIMTQRYAHHYPESLRDGVDALEAGRSVSTSAGSSLRGFYQPLKMEPAIRIERTTCGLRNRCSTN